MKDFYQKAIAFDETGVEEWCETHDDSNPIHIDETAADASMFGDRVVPGLLLLSEVSGMLTALGENDETVILAGITAARFREPLYFDQTVTISVSVGDGSESNNVTPVDVEARTSDTIIMNGVINVVIR